MRPGSIRDISRAVRSSRLLHDAFSIRTNVLFPSQLLMSRMMDLIPLQIACRKLAHHTREIFVFWAGLRVALCTDRVRASLCGLGTIHSFAELDNIQDYSKSLYQLPDTICSFSGSLSCRVQSLVVKINVEFMEALLFGREAAARARVLGCWSELGKPG